MKTQNGKYGRKAISPIIATVLIIAVTLIAAVAIGGFVFGIFGSSSNSAQVAVTGQNLLSASLAGAAGGGSPTCATGSATNSITLSNTGTAAASATSVAITYAGVVTTFTITGTCNVTPAGQVGGAAGNGNPLTVSFIAADHIGAGATVGQVYSGTVTMSNGAVLIFTGTLN